MKSPYRWSSALSHPYHHFVTEFVRLLEETRALPPGELEPAPAPRVHDNAPRALIMAPHPDDECITGGLALRLRRELHFRVTAVPVTQGSRVDRRPATLEEMRGACHFLGYELIPSRANGLDGLAGINLRTRTQNPGAWAEAVEVVAHIISYHRPSVLIMPHVDDFHSTHVGTHHLVLDALATLGPAFGCKVVETEYWRPMADPNLMIESSPEDVADLVAAVSCHRGEVARNPHHLLLPAWMADNVRRGSELVGGQGAAAAGGHFASLYRLREWKGGGLVPCLNAARYMPVGPGLETLFR